MKILVTGAAGFIGHHVARRLLGQGHDVVGIDNLNPYYDVRLKLDRLRELGIEAVETGAPDAGTIQAKESSLRFQRMDLVEAERVRSLFAEEQFELVYHLAAQAGVRYSLSNPWAYAASNMNGFLSVLEAARAHPVRHLVYAVVQLGLRPGPAAAGRGGRRGRPPGQPVCRIEALERADGAQLFAPVRGPHDGPALLHGVRPLGPAGYGAVQFHESDPERQADRVVQLRRHAPRLHLRRRHRPGGAAGRERPPQGDPSWDGRQSSVSPAPARVYNVGHGSPVALGDFVTALEEELGMKARVKKVPMQPGDVKETWADCTALREDIGFEPHTTLREGVKHFVAWYRRYHHD